MRNTLKSLVVLSALLAASVLSSPAGAASVATPKFPTRPLEIIVGFAAGGANHLAAENLTPEASAVFGQPIKITCKPGAATAVANSFVKSAPADGYTLLNGTLSLPTSIFAGDATYKVEDFTGVAMFSDVPPCLVVRMDSPIKTLKDLQEFAAKNPGKFSWGHPGVGAAVTLGGALMMFEMGIHDKVKEVPFNGTNESVAQLLGGHIHAVASFPATVKEQVRAGNLRVLGVSGTKRSDDYPDVLTFPEQGFPNVTLTSSRGIFVRSNTPPEIIAVLEAGFKQIIESEAFRQRAITLGETPVFMNSKDFTALYRQQCAMVQDVMKKVGLID